MKKVLLTRTEENNHILKNILNKKEYKILSHPFLSHEVIDNSFNNIDPNKTIILTSNFASKIISQTNLNNKFIVVGESSKNFLEQSGKDVTCFFDNVNLLEQYLHSTNCSNYIYLKGEIVTSDLSAIAEQKIIYTTNYINKLSPELENKIIKSDILTFFSYHTSQAFIKIIPPKLKKYILSKEIYCFSENISKIFIKENFTNIEFPTVANLNQFLKLF